MKACSTILEIQLIPVPSKSANFSSYLLTAEHSAPNHSWHGLTRHNRTPPSPSCTFHCVFWNSHSVISKYPYILSTMCALQSPSTFLCPNRNLALTRRFQIPWSFLMWKVTVSLPSSRAQEQVTDSGLSDHYSHASLTTPSLNNTLLLWALSTCPSFSASIPHIYKV